MLTAAAATVSMFSSSLGLLIRRGGNAFHLRVCHGHCFEWPCPTVVPMPTPSRGHGTLLSENASQDIPGDVGEAEIAAGITIGDALVVEAQQMQDRGVVIVNMAGLGDNFHAVLVRFTVDYAATYAAAAEQRAERV